MFQVYLSNMGYALGDMFASFDEALAKGKSTGFCFIIIDNSNSNVIASYDVIRGLDVF